MDFSFRDMLRRELLDRIERNSHYSARAMARDLGLSPAFLCQVLNRSRSLTENRAYDVADRLGWDGDKSRKFVTLLRYEKVRDEGSRRKIGEELKRWHSPAAPLHSIDKLHFEAMSHWVHLAILELTTVEGFVPRSSWIAKKLGLNTIEVEGAVRRLRTLGWLITEGNRWVKAHPSYTTPDDQPAFEAAIRKYHDAVLQLARRHAFDGQSDREYGSIVASSDPKLMPEIKRRIRKFQEEMMAFLEAAPRKSVYQMSIQLFRLDSGEVP